MMLSADSTGRTYNSVCWTSVRTAVIYESAHTLWTSPHGCNALKILWDLLLTKHIAFDCMSIHFRIYICDMALNTTMMLP